MRRMDLALRSVNYPHKQENYSGPLSTTGPGGKTANVNNLRGSQLRNVKSSMPYGISSRAMSGMNVQTMVNSHNDNVMVGCYDEMRPDVGAGETCLYSVGGCSIYMSANGDISMNAGASSVDLRKSGATQMYNSKGKVNIDSSGNVVVSNSKYSVIVGAYADESADGGDDVVNGVTVSAKDAKATFDGSTGVIAISKNDTDGLVKINADNSIEITKEENTGVKINTDNSIKIFKDSTSAIIELTPANDIKLTANQLAHVDIKNDGTIDIHNSVTNVTVNVDGSVSITAMNKVSVNTPSTIEFQCSQFKVNNQTMIVP